jgi:GNAT superfamily N-acetyltransferase
MMGKKSGSNTDYLIKQVVGPKWDQVIVDLQSQLFPADNPVDSTSGVWWLAFHKPFMDPVGFANMRESRNDPGVGYLSRAGVLRAHQGRGIQRRLLRARVGHAKRSGWHSVVTTTYDNVPSMRNIIKEGFLPYTPAKHWMAAGTVYWMKRLSGKAKDRK